MTQSVLLFALGFLSALFLSLLLLPSVWRRAVRLTRHGIEASLPLTMDEIVARQDQLRAQHAIQLRKAEIARDAARRKGEDLQVALAQAERRAEAAVQEAGREKGRAELADTRIAGLAKDVESRDELVRQYAGRVREAQDVVAQRNDEMERLGGLYEESSLRATGKDVELVQKEDEIAKLRQQLAKLTKDAAANHDKSAQDLEALKAAGQALASERTRYIELERRLTIAMREVGESQAKMARRDNEIDRLKQASSRAGAGATAEATAKEASLVENLERQLSAATAQAEDKQTRLNLVAKELEELRKAMLAKDDDDLRIIDLQKDNLRLAAEADQLRQELRQAPPAAPGAADAQLRETMHDLAAEVVKMAARADGDAIEKALAMPAPERRDAGTPNIVSLAERIKTKRSSP